MRRCYLSVFVFLYYMTYFPFSYASDFKQENYKDQLSEGTTLFEQFFKSRLEFNSGVDVRKDSFFGYGGFTASILSERDRAGWRVKWNTGSGEYNYHSVSGGRPITYSGKVSMHDLMLGYYFRENNFIAKVYLGANYTEHRISPFDLGNEVQGGQVGAKVQAELWYEPGSNIWSSLDLSYSSAFDDYLALGRVGYDFTPSFSLGLEGAVAGNMNYGSSRLGGVLRLKTDMGEITMNAGLGGDAYTLEDGEVYGGLSFFQKF